MTALPWMRPVCYRIDRHDRLEEFNDGWSEFARANDGVGLEPEAVRGRKLWDFVADATTVGLYQAMCSRLRDSSAPMHVHFRCDAPDRRRLLTMTMTAVDHGAIEFAVSSVSEEFRPKVALLDASTPRSTAELNMCAWCKRVQLSADRWLDVEDAVETLALFETVRLPLLSHGVCPPCYERLMRQVGEPTT
jgi:hypothetical protein